MNYLKTEEEFRKVGKIAYDGLNYNKDQLLKGTYNGVYYYFVNHELVEATYKALDINENSVFVYIFPEDKNDPNLELIDMKKYTQDKIWKKVCELYDELDIIGRKIVDLKIQHDRAGRE